MARPPFQSHDRVLLVEGSSDQHVIMHLRQSCNLSISFEIIDKRGAPNLIKSIRNELGVSNRRAVGIVLDANSNLSQNWNAVKEKISEAGIDPPDRLSSQGVIIDNSPRVGVWFMPNNQSPGEIEDFIIQMIPDDDPVWPLSRRYICDVPQEYLKGKLQKSFLHAWLATKERPGLMGAAIGAGDLDTDGNLCAGFCTWLELLFH